MRGSVLGVDARNGVKVAVWRATRIEYVNLADFSLSEVGNAFGAAIFENNKLIIVAKDEGTNKSISSEFRATRVHNDDKSTIEEALSDVDGKAKTAAVKSEYDNNDWDCPAVDYCLSYKPSISYNPFPTYWQDFGGAAGKWYLGTVGEMFTILKYCNSINAIMSVIGGTPLSNNYWTSTMYNNLNNWFVSTGFFGVNGTTAPFSVRPIMKCDFR